MQKEMAESGNGLEIVNMVVEARGRLEMKRNGALDEIVSDEIALADNGHGRIIMEENVQLEGNVHTNKGDDDSTFVLSLEKENLGSTRDGTTDTEGLGCHKEVENALGSGNGKDDEMGLSVAELVAKARAPVKSEFLTTAGVRLLVPNGTVTGTGWSTNGVWDAKKESRVVPEKKSKRQMKRERLQTVTTLARGPGLSWLCFERWSAQYLFRSRGRRSVTIPLSFIPSRHTTNFTSVRQICVDFRASNFARRGNYRGNLSHEEEACIAWTLSTPLLL